MPLWQKIVIGWLVADIVALTWFAYDMWMHPLCHVHGNNLFTHRKNIFSRWAWCDRCRITFVPHSHALRRA